MEEGAQAWLGQVAGCSGSASPACATAHCWSGPQPIFDIQIVNPAEFPYVIRDQDAAEAQGVGCDEHVISTDGPASPLELHSQFCIFPVCAGCKRQDFNPIQDLLNSAGEDARVPLQSAETHLGRHNNAGIQISPLLWRHSTDSFAHPACRIVEEIREDIRVEQVAGHQRSTGSAGRSSREGICSPGGSGSHPAMISRMSLRYTGSRISLPVVPSRRSKASSPGSSKSRGILTA